MKKQTAVRKSTAHLLAVLATVCSPGLAQTAPEGPKSEPAFVYETLYLRSLPERNDARDLTTDLRNLMPKSRIYYVADQNAISIYGPATELALARRVTDDLDRPRKLYRLTFTVSEMEGGQRGNVQSFAMVVTPGTKTNLKQGSRVPVFTGGGEKASDAMQYIDIGWNIEASLDRAADALLLHTKLELSSLAEEKGSGSGQDPVIRQGVLEGTAPLAPGKALLLGTLSFPGSARRQEIQVLCDLVP